MRIRINWNRPKAKIDYFVIRWGYFGQYPSVTKYCFNLFGQVVVFVFYGSYYTGSKQY